MDIRSANKGKGTIPPKELTPEKHQPPVPEVTENGAAVAPDESFGEDMVIEQYRKFLHENDLSDDDIKDILTALITSGNVTWKFELFNKIPVEFQVRPAWVNDYIMEQIDKMTADDPKLSLVRYNNLMAVCNLAASMTVYNGKPCLIKKTEDFDKALKFVQDMPFIVQNALVNKLAVFDRAIAVATSQWAVRNFTEPRKDK